MSSRNCCVCDKPAVEWHYTETPRAHWIGYCRYHWDQDVVRRRAGMARYGGG